VIITKITVFSCCKKKKKSLVQSTFLFFLSFSFIVDYLFFHIIVLESKSFGLLVQNCVSSLSKVFSPKINSVSKKMSNWNFNSKIQQSRIIPEANQLLNSSTSSLPNSPDWKNKKLGISLKNAFTALGFFSIAETRFARAPRLNANRKRARRCFFAVFFLCAAFRLIHKEGILSIRVCDAKFVDDTHAIHLPIGSGCEGLPNLLEDEFEHLALKRLQVVFQPIVLRRLARKKLAAVFHQMYREVPAPTVEDLKLSSTFFNLFPDSALTELFSKGTMRVYTKGMWVGAPRSTRSAARSAVNRSSKSKLATLLPALSSSGVLPSITPSLYSAFIVLHGMVTDLDNNDCNLGQCYGETCNLAEGGVTGNGFKVTSLTALTWEVDVNAIVEMIASLRNNNHAVATNSQKAFDAVMHHIVELRIQIISQYFRPTISQIQNWELFRAASAVDVTTHILPRLVPKV
jgi:hypothetical protein